MRPVTVMKGQCMSRTTTALKRLAVPGLAAVTLIAGIPVLAATSASAAPGDTITINPTADSASAGTCNPFTVTVRDSNGNPATSTVDVVVTERNNAGTTDTFDVEFCTNTTDGDTVAPNTGTEADSNQSTEGTAAELNTNTDTIRGEFTPGTDGTFTFGIVGSEAGIADVLAFVENGDNDTLDSGEARATAVKTFTAGGTQEAETVDAEPETQVNFVGETATITATVRNAAGDTLVGVQVSADIINGPNAGVTPACGSTNQDGEATCTYTGAAGTDTIVVFVNQVNADNDPATPDSTGPDAGEPQDVVQNTFATAPTGQTIDLTCGDANTPRSSAEDCINPLSENTELFSALVEDANGNPVSGGIVRFTVTTSNDTNDGTETVSPVEATTDANGVATTTLTNSEPNENEVVTVTGTIRGQDPVTSDSATKTFRTADDSEARNINITSGDNTTTVQGEFREITARVTNINGEVVPGVEVTFSETGAGAFRNGSSAVTTVTDANGIARADVTSGANETGTQTVTATITETPTRCGEAATTTVPAGDCSDTTTNTFVVATASPSPSATTSPTATPSPSATNASPPAVACNPAGIRLIDTTIIATGAARGEVRGTPNSVVLLRAYTRPSTTFFTARRVEVGADGVGEFLITPPANTRMFAVQEGCTETSEQVVLNVRTQLSLNVERLGKQTYRFFGSAIPARPNGLIVSLYRVTDSGRQVLTSQVRANANVGQAGFDPSRRPGSYSITRRFTGTGRFGFVVRTGQDLQNAPGSSNVRSLLIF
jgi:hypothetical protein